MGLFDIFKGKKGPSVPPPAGDKNVAKLARVVGDRLQQTYDRRDAIQALSTMKTAEAAAALLKRFTFYVDPSTDDQAEKDAAFDGVVAAGEAAVEPVLAFCERAESLNWPLRVLRAVADDETYFAEIIELLNGIDTDYTRNVEPKVQLLGALDGHATQGAYDAVERFLEDVSEPVRFHAVSALLSFGDPRTPERLSALAEGEESVRVRNKIAEGFVFHRWAVPADRRAAFASAVGVGGFRLDPKGNVVALARRAAAGPLAAAP